MASSSSSASKRKRTTEPSPPPSAVVESWSEYFNDPAADIILRSVDGRLFATQKMYLASASAVLEDMFKMPQPAGNRGEQAKEGQAAPGALPVVEMSEKGDELEPFLRWIHRDTFDAIYDALDKERDHISEIRFTLMSLLACARKFDAKAVFSPVFKILESRLDEALPSILALAVIYGGDNVVHQAVKIWLGELEAKKPDDGADGGLTGSMYNVRTGTIHQGQMPWSVHNIWPQLFVDLPPGFFLYITRGTHDMTFADEYDESNAVEQFMKAYHEGFPLRDPEPMC